MIRSYLQQIEASLASFAWVKSVQVLRFDIIEADAEEEILVYRFRIHMSDGGLLEIMERVIATKKEGKVETTSYRFHWQDNRGAIIKRWDNAPHFPNFESFPHHIHIGEKGEAIAGHPVNVLEILGYIHSELDR